MKQEASNSRARMLLRTPVAAQHANRVHIFIIVFKHQPNTGIVCTPLDAKTNLLATYPPTDVRRHRQQSNHFNEDDNRSTDCCARAETSIRQCNF